MRSQLEKRTQLFQLFQPIKQRRLVFTDENGSLCASLGSLTAKRQVSFYSQKF